MKVNPALFSPFQRKHIGTTVSGVSGIIPYQHNGPGAVLKPIQQPYVPLPNR